MRIGESTHSNRVTQWVNSLPSNHDPKTRKIDDADGFSSFYMGLPLGCTLEYAISLYLKLDIETNN